IGVNIFPFWSADHTLERQNGRSVATLTQTTAKNLLNALREKAPSVKGVIVTEEGWPSCSNSNKGQTRTNINDEIDYYATWRSEHGNRTFDSYYFMAYDKLSHSCDDAGADYNDGDRHFGLCSGYSKTKDTGLIACPPRR